jgi:hypothetical protein
MAADPDVRFDFDQALDWQPLECAAVSVAGELVVFL